MCRSSTGMLKVVELKCKGEQVEACMNSSEGMFGYSCWRRLFEVIGDCDWNGC